MRLIAKRSSTALSREEIAWSAGEAVMVRMSEPKSQAKRWRQ
jgi:ribosomal protein S17